MNKEDFMETIREELKTYENYLDDDIDQFNLKLNLTRNDLFDYIDKQIEYLTKIKSEYNEQFNYLEQENIKTCRDNRQEFNKLCLSINKNDNRPIIVSKLFQEFKQKFPMRPKMLKSIPQYHFKDIEINDFIFKANSPRIDHNSSSSPLINISSLDEHSQSSNESFIPINDTTTLPTTSIGSSFRKQLASQNADNVIEPQSRLVSNCSTMSEIDDMLDILFKVSYQPDNRSPCLMCFNEDENYLLIYPLLSHSRQFQCLSLNSREFYSIDIPLNDSIMNLGYSTIYHRFYLSTKQTNRFVFFRLNQQNKEIEIDEDIELIGEKDHFINVHVYENLILFLYLTSSWIVMLGKYDLETSSFLPTINFEKKLYDYEDQCPYKIIDFTVNSSYICFLIQLKNNQKNKSKILIYDYQTMDKIHSFELIDSIRPISIITTEKKSGNDENELLLYINDPDSRLIHCCTYQQYLIPAKVTNYGICSLNDGNLVIMTKKDIRALNVQHYIKKNNFEFN